MRKENKKFLLRILGFISISTIGFMLFIAFLTFLIAWSAIE